eukprot:6197143-Pleurochrysis_carterae.AAC.1
MNLSAGTGTHAIEVMWNFEQTCMCQKQFYSTRAESCVLGEVLGLGERSSAAFVYYQTTYRFGSTSGKVRSAILPCSIVVCFQQYIRRHSESGCSIRRDEKRALMSSQSYLCSENTRGGQLHVPARRERADYRLELRDREHHRAERAWR